MKSLLKSLLIYTLSTLSFVYVALMTSCSQDKCKSIACAYGGSCDNGTCKCLPGYEGSNCETITRSKFIGGWQVHEKGLVSPDRQYPIAIEADKEVTTVWLKSIYNYFTGKAVKAYIKGDTITIPNQQTMGKVIFGKGYLHATPVYGPNTGITMYYEVIDVGSGLVDDFGVNASVDNTKASEWIKMP